MEAVNSVGPAVVLWHVEFCLEGEPIERSCARQEPSILPPPLFVQRQPAITRTALAQKFTTVRWARSSLVQRTLTVLTNTNKSSVLAQPVVGLRARQKIHSTIRSKRDILRNLSREPYGEKFHALVAASHTHVLFISTLTGATLAPVAASQAFYSPPVCGCGGHGTMPWGFGGLAMSDCWVSVLIHSNTFIRRGDIWLAG